MCKCSDVSSDWLTASTASIPVMTPWARGFCTVLFGNICLAAVAVLAAMQVRSGNFFPPSAEDIINFCKAESVQKPIQSLESNAEFNPNDAFYGCILRKQDILNNTDIVFFFGVSFGYGVYGCWMSICDYILDAPSSNSRNRRASQSNNAKSGTKKRS